MPDIEQTYQDRMHALSSQERVARSLAMLQWTREILARQIQAERGPLPHEQLKWEVALRLYGSEPACCALIEQELSHVSG